MDAWKSEYYGNAHKTMLQAVDEIHNMPLDKHYAKILTVVQSSGTGKSKTVDKIATERIVFPLCLRESLGLNYFGAWLELFLHRAVTKLSFSISSHRL